MENKKRVKTIKEEKTKTVPWQKRDDLQEILRVLIKEEARVLESNQWK